MNRIRREIDQIDSEIIELLAQRSDFVAEAGTHQFENSGNDDREHQDKITKSKVKKRADNQRYGDHQLNY